MSNLFSKLRDFVGLNEGVEYEYYDDEQDVDAYNNLYGEQNTHSTIPESATQNRRWRESVSTIDKENVATGTKEVSNVIGMPGALNGISEVLVLEPRTFEEMPQAIQSLRERKSVVLNLTIMDPDQAQRAVDFIAGGTYALDGHQERIGESIFLFTPSCVQVSTSGSVLHEVHQPPLHTSRSNNSTGSNPVWGEDVNHIAQ